MRYCCVGFLEVLVCGSDGRIKGRIDRANVASIKRVLDDIGIRIDPQNRNYRTNLHRSCCVGCLDTL